MTSICFATNNKNKLEEVRAHVGSSYTILSLEDIGCFEDIPETAPTIEGNAAQKARYVAQKYKVNCFADDTGLEVNALDGAPGVYSARYAGPERSPEANMQKLLVELSDKKDRSARFKTCISLIIDSTEQSFIGEIKGTILTNRQGTKGFGYDPIFQPDGYESTFAEMSMELKNKISHRGLAVAQLLTYLTSK